MTIDELAQLIRRVDGNHSLGAAALAEALHPHLQQQLAAARNELREMTADRDSWMDQASERVKDWSEANAQLAAAREVVDHARLAEFHFSQWEDGQFPGEKAHSLKYLRGEMEALRAAIATLQRDRQP